MEREVYLAARLLRCDGLPLLVSVKGLERGIVQFSHGDLMRVLSEIYLKVEENPGHAEQRVSPFSHHSGRSQLIASSWQAQHQQSLCTSA